MVLQGFLRENTIHPGPCGVCITFTLTSNMTHFSSNLNACVQITTEICLDAINKIHSIKSIPVPGTEVF